MFINWMYIAILNIYIGLHKCDKLRCKLNHTINYNCLIFLIYIYN